MRQFLVLSLSLCFFGHFSQAAPKSSSTTQPQAKKEGLSPAEGNCLRNYTFDEAVAILKKHWKPAVSPHSDRTVTKPDTNHVFKSYEVVMLANVVQGAFERLEKSVFLNMLQRFTAPGEIKRDEFKRQSTISNGLFYTIWLTHTESGEIESVISKSPEGTHTAVPCPSAKVPTASPAPSQTQGAGAASS